jgi:hypothetical protein
MPNCFEEPFTIPVNEIYQTNVLWEFEFLIMIIRMSYYYTIFI